MAEAEFGRKDDAQKSRCSILEPDFKKVFQTFISLFLLGVEDGGGTEFFCGVSDEWKFFFETIIF